MNKIYIKRKKNAHTKTIKIATDTRANEKIVEKKRMVASTASAAAPTTTVTK